MYVDTNYQTKKQFQIAIKNGDRVRLWSPGMGVPKTDGTEYVEGPHYPQPHRWYASVTVKDGLVTSVK